MQNKFTKAITLQEALKVIGAVFEKPREKEKNWSFWTVKYETPAGDVRADYLYLLSDCPIKEATPANLERWRKLSEGNGYTTIVATQGSLSKNISQVEEEFKGQKTLTIREFLRENILVKIAKQIKDEMTDSGSGLFIEPDIILPNRQRTSATRYLYSWLTWNEEPDSSVSMVILIADGGIGKTTLARNIARSFLVNRDQKLPILVESSQWRSLIKSNLTLENVWEGAVSKIFPARIARQVLQYFDELIRENLLVPIFDGFDELCLHPNAQYSPSELLQALSELVNDSGARLLLTTRESFWESIAGDVGEQFNIIELCGFNNSQRREFFEKRVSDPVARDTALRLSKELSGKRYTNITHETQNEERASGNPFLLELVAASVNENQNFDLTAFPEDEDPLGPLIKSICNREISRQNIGVDVETQMKIFERLFKDYGDSGIKQDDLDFCIQYYSVLSKPSEFNRFYSHALLKKDDNNPRLFFPRWQMLNVYFVARWLLQTLLSDGPLEGDVKELQKEMAKSGAGANEVLEEVAQRLASYDMMRLKDSFGHALDMVMKINTEEKDSASSALFHLAARVSEILYRERLEKAKCILDLIGVQQFGILCVYKMHIKGSLQNLDFSGWVFKNCTFDDLYFRNIIFTDTTKFNECNFSGSIYFDHCSGVKDIIREKCIYSKDAKQSWDIESGASLSKEEKINQIQEGLFLALSKFSSNFRFTSIKYADRMGGKLRRYRWAHKLWDQLIDDKIVENHIISGVDNGGLNVSESEEIRREVRSFLDNRILGKALTKVQHKLLEMI